MNPDELDPTLSPSDEGMGTDDLATPEDIEEGEGGSKGPSKKSAEARINEILAKNKTLEAELNQVKGKLESIAPPPPPPSPAAPASPEAQKAADYLKQLKFVQADDVDRRIKDVEDRMALNTEHGRLESSYSGSDGRPKYDRKKVESYMRDRFIYDPEVAYKAMHETELLDWAFKQADVKRKQRPNILKPGSGSGSGDDGSITREKIEEAILTPQGRQWYEQNRAKIHQLMAEGKLG